MSRLACRWRYRRWIDRAFVGTLPTHRLRALREHLGTCAACRVRFDQLGYVDRAMSASALSPMALDRLAGSVVSPPSPPRRRTWAWLGAGATAAAAVTAILLMIRLSDPDRDEMFQPRGADRPALVPGERQPGIRMFCVVDDAMGARVVSEARLTEIGVPAQPLRCILDGELQLAYSTPTSPGLTMVAFGRDSAGRIHWYAPRSTETPLELAADVIDEPLEWSTRLAVHHAPGPHEVIARFYRGPVDREAAVAGEVPALYELRGDLIILERHEVQP